MVLTILQKKRIKQIESEIKHLENQKLSASDNDKILIDKQIETLKKELLRMAIIA